MAERAAEVWYMHQIAGGEGVPENAVDVMSAECRVQLFPVGTNVHLGAPKPGSHPGLGFYSESAGKSYFAVDGLWAQVPGMTCEDEAVLFTSASFPCTLEGRPNTPLPGFGVSLTWVDIPPVSIVDALRARLSSLDIEFRKIVLEGRDVAEREAFDTACTHAVVREVSLWDHSCILLLRDGEPLSIAAITAAVSPVDSPSLAAALVNLRNADLCPGDVSRGALLWDRWLAGRAARVHGDMEMRGQWSESGHTSYWLIQARAGCGVSCVEDSLLHPFDTALGVIFAVREHDGNVRTVAVERVQRERRID